MDDEAITLMITTYSKLPHVKTLTFTGQNDIIITQLMDKTSFTQLDHIEITGKSDINFDEFAVKLKEVLKIRPIINISLINCDDLNDNSHILEISNSLDCKTGNRADNFINFNENAKIETMCIETYSEWTSPIILFMPRSLKVLKIGKINIAAIKVLEPPKLEELECKIIRGNNNHDFLKDVLQISEISSNLVKMNLKFKKKNLYLQLFLTYNLNVIQNVSVVFKHVS